MFICCQPKTSYLRFAKWQGQTDADTHCSVCHIALNSVAFAHEETMAHENKGRVNSEFFRAHSHTIVGQLSAESFRFTVYINDNHAVQCIWMLFCFTEQSKSKRSMSQCNHLLYWFCFDFVFFGGSEAEHSRMCFMMLVLNDPQLQFTLLYNWTVYAVTELLNVSGKNKLKYTHILHLAEHPFIKDISHGDFHPATPTHLSSVRAFYFLPKTFRVKIK